MEPKAFSNTAILIFARSPHLEAKAKPLAKSPKKAARIAQLLHRHTKVTCQRSHIPTFLIDEAQQEGHNFGQRLASAYRIIFEKGYKRVIAIGNDCPSLKTSDLLYAQKQLLGNEVVLGPALDGGLYLIGMTKAAFERIDFDDLCWQSACLSQKIKASCYQLGLPLALLAPAEDIDSADRLMQVIRSLSPALAVKKALHDLYILKIVAQTFLFIWSQHLLLSIPILRGPPLPKV